MIKVLIPSIAKEVGTTAALLLQHINYWMHTQNKEKIFRTNGQIVEDLNGMFTIFQIQYAKKKLVEKGYISISYDKGCNRVSHYKITEKGVSLLKEHTFMLLNKAKDVVKKTVSTVKKGFYENNNKNTSQESYTGATTLVKQQGGTVVPETNKQPKKAFKSMYDCFNEQGQQTGDKNAARKAMELLLGKTKRDEVVVNQKIDLSPINEEHIPSKDEEMFGGVFSKIPNVDILEKQRMMKEQMLSYKEDW